MTWYNDGSTYSYGGTVDPLLVCAGWLGKGRPFRTGAAPAGFLDHLVFRCMNQCDRAYRGIHVCEVCPPDAADFVSILHEGKKHLLGTAEITVRARQRTYATPNLVVHYVMDHGYLPPDDFVEAIMGDPANPSLENWSLFRGPYWDE